MGFAHFPTYIYFGWLLLAHRFNGWSAWWCLRAHEYCVTSGINPTWDTVFISTFVGKLTVGFADLLFLNSFIGLISKVNQISVGISLLRV